MRYLLILLSFCLFIPAVQAQEVHVITVTADGEVELPADIIQFNINLNAEADAPQEAYELHKKREKVLVQLLDKYDIKEKNIRFQPISIHKSTRNEYNRNQPEQRTFYTTNQQVSLTLKDFDAYEEIQVTLIENDFDNFNGQFQSTELEQGKDEALKKAIQEARHKAELIAGEAGVHIEDVRNITYNENQYRPMARQDAQTMAFKAEASLMDYEQTVVVRESVTIEYIIR